LLEHQISQVGVLEVASKIEGGVKFPYLVSFLQTLQHVFFTTQSYIELVPRRLKKTASTEIKDMHTDLKKSIRLFINLQKNFFSEQQVHLEAAIAERPQEGLFHESYKRVLEFPSSEEVAVTNTIEKSIGVSKKTALKCILDLIKEKSKALKQLKI